MFGGKKGLGVLLNAKYGACRKNSTRSSRIGRGFSSSSVVRYDRSIEHETLIDNARTNIKGDLEKFDRSSFILSAYYPKPTRDCFMAIKAFQLEVSKINNFKKNVNSFSIGDLDLIDLKFKFWYDNISKLYENNSLFSKNEIRKTSKQPILLLLNDGINKGLNLNIEYFETYLNSSKYLIKNNYQFNSVDDICSFGEGTYSQLLYLQQSMLLSKIISPSSIKLLEKKNELQNLITDIAAHIGQSNGVATMLMRLKYYSKKNIIVLPINLMSKYDISQEALLRYLYDKRNNKEDSNKKDNVDIAFENKIKDIVYEVSTVANDHLLAAKFKLEKLNEMINEVLKKIDESKDNKNDNNVNDDNYLILRQSKNWNKKIPDAIFVPFLNSIPIEIFLNNLQKRDFNLINLNEMETTKLLDTKFNHYKLVWKSYWNYQRRKI
ncbi:uncharacterized protein ASCRUDRAFT_52988 [Ascoidea rubescens DSM 1968]|uniref:Uncharacterized protein n=1 Tax=Ascoidea rubescens DSM 1968 TaxID=1344418 RepID=A0A1D2VQD5_9ASCO|nr:hypothetical protein ASCRUDRAFT_52988 [Ascoidea rubescens DSM 1968]ODV63822.1 hypothetical protein ASCRUDRAFT_52988 [Ascoidea rubescens DSM 1968]